MKIVGQFPFGVQRIGLRLNKTQKWRRKNNNIFQHIPLRKKVGSRVHCSVGRYRLGAAGSEYLLAVNTWNGTSTARRYPDPGAQAAAAARFLRLLPPSYLRLSSCAELAGFHINKHQCFGSGWIRIQIARLDPDPYSESGSGKWNWALKIPFFHKFFMIFTYF